MVQAGIEIAKLFLEKGETVSHSKKFRISLVRSCFSSSLSYGESQGPINFSYALSMELRSSQSQRIWMGVLLYDQSVIMPFLLHLLHELTVLGILLENLKIFILSLLFHSLFLSFYFSGRCILWVGLVWLEGNIRCVGKSQVSVTVRCSITVVGLPAPGFMETEMVLVEKENDGTTLFLYSCSIFVRLFRR